MNNQDLVYRCTFPTSEGVRSITVIVKSDEAETQEQLEAKILVYMFERFSCSCDDINKYAVRKLWDFASSIVILTLAQEQFEYSKDFQN